MVVGKKFGRGTSIFLDNGRFRAVAYSTDGELHTVQLSPHSNVLNVMSGNYGKGKGLSGRISYKGKTVSGLISMFSTGELIFLPHGKNSVLLPGWDS